MVEAALFDYLGLLPIDIRVSGEDRQSIASLAEDLWDVNESQRFWRLAYHAPHLMDYEEQQIWSLLTKNPYFWAGRWERIGADGLMFVPHLSAQKLLYYRLEENWDLIKAVAAGSRSPEDLPQALTVETWRYGDTQSFEGIPRLAPGTPR